MKRTIKLPSFTGTYDSVWSDVWYYEMEHEYGVQNIDGWSFDSKSFLKDLGRGYTYFIDRLYRLYIFADLDLTYEETWPPQYYNYSTDMIFSTLEVENEDEFVKKVLELMDANKEQLSKVIKNNHTSHDGFWSLMSNEFEYWKEHLMDENELYLDYTLAYLTHILGQYRDRDLEVEAYYCVDLDYSSYWHPRTEEAKKEWEEICSRGL